MKLWTAMKEVRPRARERARARARSHARAARAQVRAYEQNGAQQDIPIPMMMRWSVLIHSDNALQDGLRQSYQNTNRYYAGAFNELNRSGLPPDAIPGKPL